MIPNLFPQYLQASQYLRIPLAIRLPPADTRNTTLQPKEPQKVYQSLHIWERGYGDLPSPMKLISYEGYEVDKIVDIFKPLTVN